MGQGGVIKMIMWSPAKREISERKNRSRTKRDDGQRNAYDQEADNEQGTGNSDEIT
jgi:hypothetical protein